MNFNYLDNQDLERKLLSHPPTILHDDVVEIQLSYRMYMLSFSNSL